MALVCVPILVHDADAALADAVAAKAHGADLVEFRIDELFSGTDELTERQVLRLAAESVLPCIVTCRAAAEGGGYDGPEDERVSLYERLGTAFGPGERPPRYLDLEFATFERSANLRQKVRLAVDHPEQLRDLKTSLILSVHDFSGRPSDLMRRVSRLGAEPAAAVVKVAYRARSVRDSLELLDLPATTGRPTIALGMGEFGLMSRVLAGKFGAFLTFASLRPGTATAPGQPTLHDLMDLYRFRSVGPATRVYGLVGWPIGHSLSPLVHNAGFGAVGHDGVYVPLPVAADDDREASYLSFKASMLELIEHPRLDLSGVSVTIPHKENLVRLAREQGWELDALASTIGAGNTLTLSRRDGRVERATAMNTDAPAVVEELAGAMGGVSGRTVVVVGAGGTARAAAVGLARAGAAVVLVNRTHRKAQQLAAELQGLGVGRIRAADVPPWSDGVEALLNCTPVGMATGPDPKGLPVTLPEGERPLVVMDTVYAPVRTPLLRAAAERGWKVVDGRGMFVRQARAQFRAWTGAEAPAGLFEGLVRSAAAGDAS